MKIRKLYILVSLILIASCQRFSMPVADDRVLLATVGERSLYLDEIKGIFYSGVTEQDSVDMLTSYIDKWVKNRIKIDRATLQFADDSKDIDKLIEEYRNSLLLTKYDNYHTFNIDTVITQNDVNEYYYKHREMFKLSNPIVKLRIISYPKSYRAEKKLLDLLKSDGQNERTDLFDLAEKNDFTYKEFSDWVYFSETLAYIPFNEKQFDDFLRKNSTYSVENGETKYVMIVDSYKNSGNYSPVKMVESVVRKMIIRDRRNLQLKTVEDSLYNEAIALGEITLINNLK